MADTETQLSVDSKSLAREHEEYKQKTAEQTAFVEVQIPDPVSSGASGC